MAFQISWTIEGEQQLSRRLRQIRTDATDFRKPFKRSADRLVSIFRKDVFNTRGAVIGEKWRRLSPATVAAKARSGFPIQPLVRTGRMKRSFQSLVKTDQAVVFNNTKYFKYHQSNKPRRKIPRRVMMKLGINQREMVVKIFHAHLRKIMQ